MIFDRHNCLIEESSKQELQEKEMVSRKTHDSFNKRILLAIFLIITNIHKNIEESKFTT